MTSEKLSFLVEILTFGEEGAVIRGRNMGTALWADLYGTYGIKKYVVEKGDGELIVATDDIAVAWGAWKGNET